MITIRDFHIEGTGNWGSSKKLSGADLKNHFYICSGIFDTSRSIFGISIFWKYHLKKYNLRKIICEYLSIETIEWSWTDQPKKLIFSGKRTQFIHKNRREIGLFGWWVQDYSIVSMLWYSHIIFLKYCFFSWNFQNFKIRKNKARRI